MFKIPQSSVGHEARSRNEFCALQTDFRIGDIGAEQPTTAYTVRCIIGPTSYMYTVINLGHSR
jgi:hypothetical protein